MIWVDGDDSSSTTPPSTTSPSQSDTKSPTQPKKKITRTRTGCQTCRDRKVKCGEERPQCNNCLRTNHVCPGYAPATVFKANRKGRRSTGGTTDEAEGSPVNESQPSQPIILVAPGPTENFDDLKLLHYYTTELSHTLSLPGAIGRTWSDGVPRLAFDGDHAYLIHALLAAAAAHKVSRNTDDTQLHDRGQMHYNQSIGLLKSLDPKTLEDNTSAALATVMLLIWYESLYGCWENGLLHIHGAENIIRQHNQDLLKTSVGRQLSHLFARLELAASRHLLLDNNITGSTDIFDKVAFDPETLRYEDVLDGTSDFEILWTQLLKIMVPITVLRTVPRTADRGTPERKEEGRRIQELLNNWEQTVSGVFKPVPAPDSFIYLDNSILDYLQPIYYPSFNIAVAMAHHAALRANIFTLTHRGDEPRPNWFFEAVQRTLQICLGVAQLRQLGLLEFHEGGDFGILWPLVIAGIWAPEGQIRLWILDLLSAWPKEGMIDPVDVRVSLEAIWSRIDFGFGFEGLYNEDPNRAMMDRDKPIRLEISERALSDPNKGQLRTVEVTVQDRQKLVRERSWHRGDMVLEHVKNISRKPPMVLPP